MKVPRTRSLRTRDVIQEFAREAETNGAWDELSDAFEPVRALVEGTDPLVPDAVYEQLRKSTARVLASVSVVEADEPWAFFAVKGTQWGAPRWVLLDRPDASGPGIRPGRRCFTSPTAASRA